MQPGPERAPAEPDRVMRPTPRAADREPAERGGTRNEAEPTIAFRPWTPADRAVCLALLDANSPRFFGARDRVEYLAFLANPYRPYWVMLDPDGAVVGCGGAAIDRANRVGYLTYGMVHPDRHGQGLGTRLTAFRLRWLAAQPGIDRVLIDTSNETEGFYARFGFRTLRVIPDSYAPSLHEHDMELVLDDARRALLA